MGPMEDMHDEITKVGRVGPSTGVIWLGRRLGMLTDSPPTKGEAHSHMIKLGKEQGQYWVRENLDGFPALIDAFSMVPALMRVATHSGAPLDVTRACDAVMDAVAKGFDVKAKEGKDAGGYVRKTVGRKFLAYGRKAAHSHEGRHSQAALRQ